MASSNQSTHAVGMVNLVHSQPAESARPVAVGEQCYGCHVAEDDHLGSRVESWLAFWTMDEACVAHVGSAAVCRLLMSSIVQVVGVWTWGAAQESRRCASGGSTMKQERSMAGGR